nr:electron transfer flavoprotein subunit beta/FixA family protein [Spelaeicoccus albus]
MDIDAGYVGYTLSSHDECAIELASQIAEETKGTATALSVGSPDAAEQLRGAVALGCRGAILLEAELGQFGPVDIAAAIAAEVARRSDDGEEFDLILVGNDAADTGDFQVGVRLAYLLGRPVAMGISTVEIDGDRVMARGVAGAGTEIYSLPLPAVVAIQEGGVDPRYPSIPGRMRAKRMKIEQRPADVTPSGSGRVRLRRSAPKPSEVQILGEGPDAAAALVDVMYEIGVVPR